MSISSPSPADALLTLGSQPLDPSLHPALLEERAALLQMALDPSLRQGDRSDPAYAAPLHALAFLRLHPAPAIFKPLHSLLGRTDEEIRNKTLEIFEDAGEIAFSFLVDAAADWALSPSHRLQTIDALTRLTKKHPHLQDRLTQALTALLDRPDSDLSAAEEEINDRLILALYQAKATTSFPSIQRAFDEDRTTGIGLSLDAIRQAFGLSANPSRSDKTKVHLALRCLACKRERLHALPFVFYDMEYRPRPGDPGGLSPLFIPTPVVCPKCQTTDQYELSTRGHLEVTIQMMRHLTASSASKPDDIQPPTNGPIRFISFQKYIGKPLHPREALHFFEKAVSADPKDPKARINYAQVLKLHQRHKDADRHLYDATQIDPTNPEPYAWLGQMAEDNFAFDEAFHWWTKTGDAAFSSKTFSPKDKDLWLATMRQRLEYCYDQIALRLRPGQPHPFGNWKERILQAERDAHRKRNLSKARSPRR